ncbi:auxin-responsive protein SAUR50-like [Bidens hawaiensis]|uniref:auxin-responsive protein SAUR50-like n=1 Tax=Bidens hawaiensis TaxID=980011 RepID=UPI00404ABBA1
MLNKKRVVVMVEKLQKRLFVKNIDGGVPEDVKEGHFAVIAVDEYEERRFVVPVSCLKQASFVKLLERAAEEYGFEYDGVVVIPCRPSELERILAQQEAQEKMLSCKPFSFTKHY